MALTIIIALAIVVNGLTVLNNLGFALNRKTELNRLSTAELTRAVYASKEDRKCLQTCLHKLNEPNGFWQFRSVNTNTFEHKEEELIARIMKDEEKIHCQVFWRGQKLVESEYEHRWGIYEVKKVASTCAEEKSWRKILKELDQFVYIAEQFGWDALTKTNEQTADSIDNQLMLLEKDDVIRIKGEACFTLYKALIQLLQETEETLDLEKAHRMQYVMQQDMCRLLHSYQVLTSLDRKQYEQPVLEAFNQLMGEIEEMIANIKRKKTQEIESVLQLFHERYPK